MPKKVEMPPLNTLWAMSRSASRARSSRVAPAACANVWAMWAEQSTERPTAMMMKKAVTLFSLSPYLRAGSGRRDGAIVATYSP